jgi:hypothetical protein
MHNLNTNKFADLWRCLFAHYLHQQTEFISAWQPLPPNHCHPHHSSPLTTWDFIQWILCLCCHSKHSVKCTVWNLACISHDFVWIREMSLNLLPCIPLWLFRKERIPSLEYGVCRLTVILLLAGNSLRWRKWRKVTICFVTVGNPIPWAIWHITGFL